MGGQNGESTAKEESGLGGLDTTLPLPHREMEKPGGVETGQPGGGRIGSTGKTGATRRLKATGPAGALLSQEIFDLFPPPVPPPFQQPQSENRHDFLKSSLVGVDEPKSAPDP